VVVEAGAGLLELRPVSMSLEEVFLKLVTHEDGGPADASTGHSPHDGRGGAAGRKGARA
jgi:hypothetical protein